MLGSGSAGSAGAGERRQGGTRGCFCSQQEGSRTVGTPGMGHRAGQPLALTVVLGSKEEAGELHLL